MIGKRIQPDENGWFNGELQAGEYVHVDPKRMADGSPLSPAVNWASHYPMWLVCAPNGHACSIRSHHKVVEHADGTITISQSILITCDGEEVFHGFLEAGVWRYA